MYTIRVLVGCSHITSILTVDTKEAAVRVTEDFRKLNELNGIIGMIIEVIEVK